MTGDMWRVLFDRAPFEPPFPVPCVACGYSIAASNDWKCGVAPGTWAHRACDVAGGAQ